MSNLNGREVKMARVQTIIYIPDVGQMGPTLDANSASKRGLGSMKLFKVDGGLHLVGSNWEGYVPDGNITCIQFVPESK